MRRFTCFSLMLGLPLAAPAFAHGGGGGHLGGFRSSSSSHYTGSYVTRDGTYVAPHWQTNPNSTQTDNYSARGNLNPYTGAIGDRSVSH